MKQLPTADPYLPGHGDPSYHVRHYELDIRSTLRTNRLDGEAVLSLTTLSATGRIVLDLAGLRVGKLQVTGARLRSYHQRGSRLVLTLREQVPAETELTVTVRYSGRPAPLIDRHHGDAGWEELDDGVIVAAQPHGAPTWFPCNDRPSDKATYRITVTTDAGYTVVSNGEPVSHTRRGSTETWVFAEAAPMATYLATVQIGRYQDWSGPADPDDGPTGATVGVPMRVVAPAGMPEEEMAAAFGRQPEMMALFIDLFGPYPFDGYAAVVTADELEIPLESQSLSTFGSNFVSADWEQTRLIAHELAHQWFGNAVTLTDWRDIWLHEGFACYAEWLWSHASDQGSCDDRAREHWDRLSGLPQDLLLSDPTPELMFDDRVYKRGALALHALRTTIGDDDFFALLRAWVADNSGGGVTTDDFVALVRERGGQTAADLLGPWLHELALPDLP